ncbi:MAG: hypothetical protein AB1918_12965 [Pseudomonadota bacterium]
MKTSSTVILAPNGFPWGALLAWTVVVAATMILAGKLLPSLSPGATFTIGGLLGNAAFATVVGRCRGVRVIDAAGGRG